MAERKVTLALVGLGRAGKIHFGNMITNYRVSLKWIVEEDTAHAKSVVNKFLLSGVTVVPSSEFKRVLEDDSVEGVIVCTPTWTHESIVQASVKAGKHVFCEKPISTSIEVTKACYEEASKNKRMLFCAFNRRFDPALRYINKKSKAGEIGQIQQVKTMSRDAPLPPMDYLRNSGGIFHDCAVHDIDVVCWMLGERPATVYAQAHAFHPEIHEMDDVDTVAITMKFPSGALGVVDLSRYAAYGYDQRVEVFGSAGMFQSHNIKVREVAHHTTAGEGLHPIHHSFTERYAQSYKQELEHFIDVIIGKESKCDVTCEDTVSVAVIADACERSYRIGRPVCLEDGKPVS